MTLSIILHYDACEWDGPIVDNILGEPFLDIAVTTACFQSSGKFTDSSDGNDLNQMIYKSRFKSLFVIFELDLNQ